MSHQHFSLFLIRNESISIMLIKMCPSHWQTTWRQGLVLNVRLGLGAVASTLPKIIQTSIKGRPAGEPRAPQQPQQQLDPAPHPALQTVPNYG